MKRIVHWLIIAVLWLLIWQTAHALVNMSLLFPSPYATFSRLLELALTIDFWYAVFSSMLRILIGFLLGLIVGSLLAVLTSVSAWCYDFFKPLLSVIKATPVASFIILALIFFTSSRVPAFAAFLIVMPIIWANVHNGIKKTDRQLLAMARAYDFKRRTTVRHIYLPSLLPYFTAAATTAMGMAWKAGIAAEVIAVPRNAIGAALYESKIYLATTDLFAWTVMIILLSLLLEGLFTRLVNQRKRRPASTGSSS